MPDFSRPGNDGAVPDGFPLWRRGVTCTVRPEMRPRLPGGRNLHLNATVRRKVAKDGAFTAYGLLYQRCTEILRSRLAPLASPAEPLHTWIEWQAWWCGAVADKYPAAGDFQVACASITLGVSDPLVGAPGPAGQSPPAAERLRSPDLTELPSPQLPTHFDEAYIDFDFQDPGAPGGGLTFSYGEYAPPAQAIDFEPFVGRAEKLALGHSCLWGGAGFEVARREWFAESNLVVVMVLGFGV